MPSPLDFDSEQNPVRSKKKFDPAFKAKVALAALMSGKSLIELSERFDLHPCQISQWKMQLIRRAELAFKSPQRIRYPSADENDTD